MTSVPNPQTPFDKDPDATLDYTVDWTDWLEGNDAISTSNWSTTPSGELVLVTSAIATGNKKAVGWFASGTVDQVYAVRNRITTSGGRSDDRTFYIRVTHT